MRLYRLIPKLSPSDLCRFYDKIKIDYSSGCWQWIGTKSLSSDNLYYGMFGIQGQMYLASRISYYIKYGHCPIDLQVGHICNNSICVNPKHLELCTQSENTQYSYDCGRSCKIGEFNSASKLTEKEVKEISESQEQIPILAKRYIVTVETIRHIKTGKTWRYLL